MGLHHSTPQLLQDVLPGPEQNIVWQLAERVSTGPCLEDAMHARFNCRVNATNEGCRVGKAVRRKNGTKFDRSFDETFVCALCPQTQDAAAQVRCKADIAAAKRC